MARNRQRAKARRARREANEPSRVPRQDDVEGKRDITEEADLAVGAPPEDLGRSDQVAAPQAEQEAPRDELKPAKIPAASPASKSLSPKSTPAKPSSRERDGSRIINFFKACVAELRRVQWPDRQQVTTLSGVVLGFVVIAGGYLGLLDAIFSKVVNQLLNI